MRFPPPIIAQHAFSRRWSLWILVATKNEVRGDVCVFLFFFFLLWDKRYCAHTPAGVACALLVHVRRLSCDVRCVQPWRRWHSAHRHQHHPQPRVVEPPGCHHLRVPPRAVVLITEVRQSVVSRRSIALVFARSPPRPSPPPRTRRRPPRPRSESTPPPLIPPRPVPAAPPRARRVPPRPLPLYVTRWCKGRW